MKKVTRSILAATAAVKMHQVFLGDEESHDQQDNLTDLLTDLRHWAKDKGLNMNNAVNSSYHHFNAEQNEQGDSADTQRRASTRKQ